jgi:hypothetical protein
MRAKGLLVGKPGGKRPIGRPRCKWIVKIKKDQAKIEFSGVNYTGLVQDRDRWRALVNLEIN